MEFFASAGKNFMAISLMTHIPNQAVVGCIKNIV